MTTEKILVIEDDEDIQELVRYNLESDGYKVTCTPSGQDGLKIAESITPDLIILDRMLPGMEGLDVCRALRAADKTKNIPVIMLTAKGEESDIVAGLELGADDYITKPFSPKILIARIRTALRRKNQEPNELVSAGPIKIDNNRHEVFVEQHKIILTSTEYKILNLLARRPGWVFSRDQIVDSVHGDNYAVTDRSVDVQITGLRRKLGSAAEFIETVRGAGYRLKN